MSFFGRLFAHGESIVVLIDVGSTSVGIGYARLSPGTPAELLYGFRQPLASSGKDESQRIAKSVAEAAHELVRSGASALRRAHAHKGIDRVIIAVGAPWQETIVRSDRIDTGQPFTFTRSLMHETVEKSCAVADDRLQTGRDVITVYLNGYPTDEPFGRKVNNAELVTLSSSINRAIADQIRAAIRSAFHANTIDFVAVAPAAYTVIRDLYPHESDFLMVDVGGQLTSISFVKTDVLVDVATVSTGLLDLLHASTEAGINTGEPVAAARALSDSLIDPKRNASLASRIEKAQTMWREAVTSALKEFATRHALPRTIFLLADVSLGPFFTHLLDDPSLRSLWLSDEPLSIILLKPSMLTPHVTFVQGAHPDTFLGILALYAARADTVHHA